MRAVLCRFAQIALCLSGIGTAPAAIRFEGFASAEGLDLVGDAAVAGKVLRLTPAKRDRVGAAWFHQKQPLAAGFETTFRFLLPRQGGLGHGADGFAFVMQNSGPEARGGRGSAGGFAVSDAANHHDEAGIPWSIAVFFDTYKNDEEDDPSANYLAICTAGRPSEMRWPASRVAFTPDLPIRLKDGNVHTARILFHPPVLTVFVDDSPSAVLESIVDLSIVMDWEGESWVGFTASTGGGFENHDILNWSFTGADVSSSMSVVSSQISYLTAACLPDRILCTPEGAIVERRSAGYHVVLPGNLEWGASIPNPTERSVVVTNARGTVCWDVGALGSNGCSGPAGSGLRGGQAFLATDAAAGALIMRNSEGRAWFSVNGRSGGGGFRDNQGFYEFDLEIK